MFYNGKNAAKLKWLVVEREQQMIDILGKPVDTKKSPKKWIMPSAKSYNSVASKEKH